MSTKKSTKSNSKSSNKRAKNIEIKVSRKVAKRLAIAAICLVLILAIALGAFYLVAPDSFMRAFNKIFARQDIPSTLDGDILEVRFLDVGQGDCAIIRFPDGKNMIIDAGGTASKDKVKPLDVIMNEIDSLGIKTFDYMMATHSDTDHVDFLDEILAKYEVKRVYRPAFLSRSEARDGHTGQIETGKYDDFITAVHEEKCEVVNNIGQLKIEGEGYSMDIYAPKASMYDIDTVGDGGSIDARERNRVSPFCILNYHDRRVVFTGDAEGKGGNGAEEMLIKDYNFNPIDCDVLKVGHHGSETSSSMRFLNLIDVEYAVISAGVDNKHDHPRPELLERLNAYVDPVPDGDFNGINKIFRTDKDGSKILHLGANGGLAWAQ